MVGSEQDPGSNPLTTRSRIEPAFLLTPSAPRVSCVPEQHNATGTLSTKQARCTHRNSPPLSAAFHKLGPTGTVVIWQVPRRMDMLYVGNVGPDCLPSRSRVSCRKLKSRPHYLQRALAKSTPPTSHSPDSVTPHAPRTCHAVDAVAFANRAKGTHPSVLQEASSRSPARRAPTRMSLT